MTERKLKGTPTQVNDARLRRAKKFNVATSTASGALGVGALGALGARYAPSLAPKAMKGHKSLARIQRAGEKATLPLTASSLGVGGVGSLNFAAVQNREANKLPKMSQIPEHKKVRKSMDYGMDFGLSSVHQGENISKYYDPERNRERRMNAASGGMAVGAGAAGVAAVPHARRAVASRRDWRGAKTRFGSESNKVMDIINSADIKNPGAARARLAGARAQASKNREMWSAAKKATGVSGGKAAGLAALSGGLLIGADQVQRYKSGRGRSYNERAW